MIHYGIRGHAVGEPDITADDTTAANNGFTTQYGCSGINDYMVFNGRMSFLVGQFFCHIQSAQCYTLVDLYMVTDNGGLSDYNTGAVIDGKRRSYFCARVDIDACFAVRIFRENARQGFDALQVQLVCDAINSRGIKARVSHQYFFDGLGCRVELQYCFRIQ